MMRRYFVYLDEESGDTNMFGAPSYLVAMFGLSRTEAMEVTYAWMKTFGKGDLPVEERVALAEAAGRIAKPKRLKAVSFSC